jgi:hypothetical protein
MPETPKKPTAKQLSYLRTLAQRTGQTFTWPNSTQEASAQIRRLKGTPASSRLERQIEHKQIADQIASAPADSTRVRDDEVHGWGSTATWANQPTRAAGAPAAKPPAANVGKRTELARYTTPAGERILVGQRVNEVVRVSDIPASPGGRAYLVERGLEQDGNSALNALIADYLQQAQMLADVPMRVPPVDGLCSEPSGALR